MPEWKPIETAPRDDRRVLVFVPPRPNRVLIRCLVAWRRGGDWYTIPNGIRIAPTHWMPLPDDPFAHVPFTLEAGDVHTD